MGFKDVMRRIRGGYSPDPKTLKEPPPPSLAPADEKERQEWIRKGLSTDKATGRVHLASKTKRASMVPKKQSTPRQKAPAVSQSSDPLSSAIRKMDKDQRKALDIDFKVKGPSSVKSAMGRLKGAGIIGKGRNKGVWKGNISSQLKAAGLYEPKKRVGGKVVKTEPSHTVTGMYNKGTMAWLKNLQKSTKMKPAGGGGGEKKPAAPRDVRYVVKSMKTLMGKPTILRSTRKGSNTLVRRLETAFSAFSRVSKVGKKEERKIEKSPTITTQYLTPSKVFYRFRPAKILETITARPRRVQRKYDVEKIKLFGGKPYYNLSERVVSQAYREFTTGGRRVMIPAAGVMGMARKVSVSLKGTSVTDALGFLARLQFFTSKRPWVGKNLGGPSFVLGTTINRDGEEFSPVSKEQITRKQALEMGVPQEQLNMQIRRSTGHKNPATKVETVEVENFISLSMPGASAYNKMIVEIPDRIKSMILADELGVQNSKKWMERKARMLSEGGPFVVVPATKIVGQTASETEVPQSVSRHVEVRGEDGNIVTLGEPRKMEIEMSTGAVELNRTADTPLIWTGQLVNSIESWGSWEERAVFYGVKTDALHIVSQKPITTIAHFMMKQFNFLALPIVKDAVREIAVNAVKDYIKEEIMGIQEKLIKRDYRFNSRGTKKDTEATKEAAKQAQKEEKREGYWGGEKTMRERFKD